MKQVAEKYFEIEEFEVVIKDFGIDIEIEGEDGSTFKARFQFGSDFFWF